MPRPPRSAHPPDHAPAPLPACAQRVPDGLVLRLKVVAGASRSALAGALDDRLKVRVAAPAHAGQANAAVRALIGAWLGCRQVEILTGASSSAKTVHVPGLTALSSARSQPPASPAPGVEKSEGSRILGPCTSV